MWDRLFHFLIVSEITALRTSKHGIQERTSYRGCNIRGGIAFSQRQLIGRTDCRIRRGTGCGGVVFERWRQRRTYHMYSCSCHHSHPSMIVTFTAQHDRIPDFLKSSAVRRHGLSDKLMLQFFVMWNDHPSAIVGQLDETRTLIKERVGRFHSLGSFKDCSSW